MIADHLFGSFSTTFKNAVFICRCWRIITFIICCWLLLLFARNSCCLISRSATASSRKKSISGFFHRNPTCLLFLAHLFTELFSEKVPPLSCSFFILQLEFWIVDFIQTVDYRFPSQFTSGTSFFAPKMFLASISLRKKHIMFFAPLHRPRVKQRETRGKT